MKTLIAVLLIVGSAAGAVLYHYRYHYRFKILNIEKTIIKKHLREGKNQEQIKKTRLNKTAVKVILVALAIILLPITIATAFFGFIWYLILTNLSGGIRLLIVYWWILAVALVTHYLYHKLSVVIVVCAIGALIPPLWSAVMGIREYLHARYELALQEVREEASRRDEEERRRIEQEQTKDKEQLMTAEKEKEATEALKECEKQTELAPSNAALREDKGNALCELGNYNERLEKFHRLVKEYDETIAEESLQECEKEIELDPEDWDAWEGKASALYQLGRYEEALQAYEKATVLYSEDADAWKGKASALYQLDRYEEALQACDRAIELNPNDASLWKRRAEILSELDRHEERLEALDKAMRLDPENADLQLDRANTLHDLGRYDEALIMLDKAILLNPKDSHAWFWKGSTLYRLHNYPEAVKAFDKAIELNPQDDFLWWFKGNTLIVWDKYEEAVEAFDKAIALSPNDASSWRDKGVALKLWGRHNNALAAFDKAIALNHRDASLWWWKGRVLDNLNKPEEALRAFEKGLELDPDNAETKADLKEGRDEMLSKLGRRKTTRGNELQGKLEYYNDDYMKLPWYGIGEKGVSTKEFAEMLGIQKSEARKLLENWQALGKVTSRLTNTGSVWWHM